MYDRVPRIHLGHFPTPIEELKRLSEQLRGPRLMAKRDDLTGLAEGGNKTRKLEFLLADALQRGAHTVITAGAVQSNHARQTAAAAAHCGLACVLVLSAQAPESLSGNLLLDRLLGAQVRWTGDRDPREVMAEVAEEERAAGRVPYIIPYGGSNPIGATGYALAMDELVRQTLSDELRVDCIVAAASSGGTLAGMVVGARALGFKGQLLGISVAPPREQLQRHVFELAQLTATHLELRIEIPPDSFQIEDAYVGQGYGIVGEAERQAIRLAATTEGLFLDPVYTGRAMAGLLDLIRRGRWRRDQTVLFWHTGGTPALYAYANDLFQP